MLRTLKIGLHKYVIIFLMKTFLEGGGEGGGAFIRREHLKKGALVIFF